MADKSVFSRLKRLFSTDVIIRNVGGNQVKVIDSGKIQSTGELQTNSLIDRYNRIWFSLAINLCPGKILFPNDGVWLNNL